MANKYDGEVSIRLDRVRVLKFDMNALAEFEGEMGETVPALLLRIQRAQREDGTEGVSSVLGFREVRALTWAALLHEDERLTLKDVGRMIAAADGKNQMEKVAAVAAKVVEAFLLFQGVSPSEAEELSKKAEGEIQPPTPNPTT